MGCCIYVERIILILLMKLLKMKCSKLDGISDIICVFFYVDRYYHIQLILHVDNIVIGDLFNR